MRKFYCTWFLSKEMTVSFSPQAGVWSPGLLQLASFEKNEGKENEGKGEGFYVPKITPGLCVHKGFTGWWIKILFGIKIIS